MHRYDRTGKPYGVVKPLTAFRSRLLVAAESATPGIFQNSLDCSPYLELHLPFVDPPAGSSDSASGRGPGFNFISLLRPVNFARFTPIFYATGSTLQPFHSNSYED
jgi:hypothetical protein